MELYQYCANNPVNFIDPTGMIWEDHKQKKRLIGNVNSKIETLQKGIADANNKIINGKLSDENIEEQNNIIQSNQSRIEDLQKTLEDIELLDRDSNRYMLSSSSPDQELVSVRQDNGIVYIQGMDTSYHIHEITHVTQALAAGGLKFNSKGFLLNQGNPIKKANNELEAFQRQFSYGGGRSVELNATYYNEVTPERIYNEKRDKNNQPLFPIMTNLIQNKNKEK